jgi:hypothetical protein
MSSQSGSIRTSAFNPESNDIAETGSPTIKPPVAGASRAQPILTQSSAKLVNGYGYMFVAVCVDSNNNLGNRQVITIHHSYLLVFECD